MRKRLCISILLALALAGCAAGRGAAWIPLITPGISRPQQDFSATVPRGWMLYAAHAFFLITRDGVQLEHIMVVRRPAGDTPEYAGASCGRGMTTKDLADAEIANLRAKPGAADVTIIADVPGTIDGIAAYVVEYTYNTQENLKIRGIQYGFMRDDWVYRIRFEAAQQHYFAQYKKDFEAFIASFKIHRGGL